MVACPYGRLQSVLLDRRSLIVGYDARRGEPRGHLPGGRLAVVAAPAQLGDCIDCGACVTCCPTGIDIRDGLQMECIHCTQCMDACDSIMDGIGRPRGLIRYSSRDELAGQPRRMLRPRVVIYPLLLAVVWGALAYALLHRAPADVTVLRGIGSPFTVTPSGMVMNQIRVKIVNRDAVDRRYQVELVEPAGAPATLGLVAPENPLPVPAGKSATAPFFVTAPRAAFDEGRREVGLRIDNGAGWSTVMPYRLLGPGDDDDHEHKRKDKSEHEGDRGR